VLDWAVETMEGRYALLSAAGVRNLADYNALGEEKLKTRLGPAYDPERTPPHLPVIVMIIDEFADLMSVAAAEVEVSIQRLAQKSRAVGIHVILATQRPSRDVITGLIKANLPTRIAFQVSSRVDSRVVLDSNGAEQLLGHGDMLYIPPGTNRLVRAQGTFVSDDEIHAVVAFLEEHARGQDFAQELVQVPTGSARGGRERDDMYERAVEVVLEEQRGSATLLQRKLAVGYTRASRLIELMAEDGVVGEFVGSKSREVLMTLDDWRAKQAAQAPAREAAMDPVVLPTGGRDRAVIEEDMAMKRAEDEVIDEEAPDTKRIVLAGDGEDEDDSDSDEDYEEEEVDDEEEWHGEDEDEEEEVPEPEAADEAEPEEEEEEEEEEEDFFDEFDEDEDDDDEDEDEI
jgi:S-DNA-T family DNA segregation ATPase FtsK/SpoIIIE